MLLLQIVLITVPVSIAVLGLRKLLQRRLSTTVVTHAERVVPLVLSTVGGFYGLVAGFMLSNAWVELRGLRNAMTAEVNALADMSDIAINLPAPRATALQHAVNRYLQSVVQSELPLMAAGETSPLTTRALTDLWGPVSGYQPQSDWEVSIRGIAINKIMSIGEQRRQRVVFARERVPPIVWWTLCASALVVIVGACVLTLNYRYPSGPFLVALTALVTLVLFAIHVLERPFQYQLATEASEYISLWNALGGPETYSAPSPR